MSRLDFSDVHVIVIQNILVRTAAYRIFQKKFTLHLENQPKAKFLMLFTEGKQRFQNYTFKTSSSRRVN